MGSAPRTADSPTNVSARNQLIEQHMGLVYHAARRLHHQLSTEASLDDLISAGSIGLINAAENFDASRGLAFSTFALPRVRGAMLDDLRAQDRVPRSARRKARVLNTAREVVAQRAGAAAATRDVATELGVGVETVWQWDADLAAAQSVSLDRSSAFSDDEDGAQLQIAGDAQPADDRLAQQEMADRIRTALEALPARERQVLALYYYEELTQQQIGQVLGVTESRVSQLRSQAIARLQSRSNTLQGLLVA